MTVTPTPGAPSLLPGEDTGASDSDGVIDLSGPMLVGQTLPNATITLYDSGIATTVANATADANGFYSIYPYPVLDDGKHTLTITATAPGDTPSQYSAPLYIVVDTSKPDPPTAPQLAAGLDTGISAEDGITDKNVIQLTGTAEPGSTVMLYDVDKDNKAKGPALAMVTAAADGTYTLTTGALADGAYSFDVTATDLAGNVSMASATTSITVDTMAPPAPSAPTLSPGTDTGVSHSDGLTDNDTPVVVGTTEANATVELFDGAKMVAKATADGSGNYAITADRLDEGPHALTVKAVDAAGNVSTASPTLNVVIDETAPTATITPALADVGAGSIAFMVHFSEPVAGVTANAFTLAATNTVSGSVQSVTGSGADYTVTVSGLDGQGTVALSLVSGAITDLAGNAAVLKESDSHAVSGTTQPTTIEVSTTTSGLLGTGTDPSTSASGRAVAFTTLDAQELTTGPATDGVANVVVRDTLLGVTTLVSVGPDGKAANGSSGGASIDANGTEIAFVSDATNIVDPGSTPGQANVYLAKITEGVSGPKVGDITQVSFGNGQQGEGTNADGSEAFDAPIISADGSTVAFDSTQALVAGAESGVENVYSYDVATEKLTLVSGGTGKDEYGIALKFDPGSGEYYETLVEDPDKAAGTGGDFNSEVTSVSANGKLIGFDSTATDLGGPDVDPIDEVLVPSRGYVYNTITGATTYLDGTYTVNPSASADTAAYNVYDPVLSGDGSKVYYEVHYVLGVQQVQALYQYAFATTPVSVPSAGNSFEDYVFDTSTSTGGSLVLFQENPGYYTNQYQYQAILDNVATGTMTALTPGYVEKLTSAGNAYVYSEEPNGAGSDQLYETNLGVSVGIDPIGNDDAVDESMLAKAAAGSGLTVTGTTNAPRGALVQAQFFGASADTNTLNSTVVIGTVDGLGHWSATVPTALLQSADGNYALAVQVGTPTGNSFLSLRDFIVDTKAPATPDAPKLDAGSDTSLASDGSATNQDTPTLTGTAEAGATITLYDTSSPSPTSPIGTAVADSTGVYAIKPSAALVNGKHTLDVTATDAAGNVSDASDGVTFTVDTKAPVQPTAALDPLSDTGLSNSDGITSNASPTIVGTAEAGTTVTLYDTDGIANLGTATVGTNGTYSIAASSLSDGAHTLTVTDTDAAGNVSPASAPIAVTVDTLPPLQPTISSVTGPLVSGDISPLVTVNGTAEPGSKVQLVLDGGMGTDSIFGESTAASDGDYSIYSDPLPAGDGQNLTVTATDVAGNTSQPSLPVDVNITDTATPPPGVPPFTPTLIGLLTDGPIDGATVFTDTNSNGTRDPDEGSAITDANGDFQLVDTGGELIATGGTDSTTGIGLPGTLTAPAHSTVIDPLTTLMDAYIQRTGAGVAAANAAVAAALGLLGGGATVLTSLDPNAAAIAGSAALDPAVANGAAAIASAKLADLAADVSAVLSHQVLRVPVSASDVFADVFTVLAAEIAALPTGDRLDLDNPSTLLATVEATAALASGSVPDAVAEAAEQIVAAGNMQLDTDAADEQGQALLAGIANVETVEQGNAAAALGQIGANPSLAATLVPQYTGASLVTQASVTAALITDAPRLAPGSDQGLSTTDNVTDDLSPTFVGTALPGTFVTLVEQGQVLGNAQADSSGHYSITIAPLTVTGTLQYPLSTFGFVAVGSTTDQHLAVGAIITLPQGVIPQEITFDAPGLSDGARIANATPAAAMGDDAGHSALLVSVYAFAGDFVDIQVYADGGATPIGSAADNGENGLITLTTTPLSLGPHMLTVTETLRGGEVIAGNPSFNVTVTAPTVVDGTARAVGAIAGGTVTESNGPAAEEGDLVRSVTDDDGAYDATVLATPNPDVPLTLTDGYDTVTGLPIGGPLADFTTIDGKGGATLTAPSDYTAISPLSSIVAGLDTDDANSGFVDPNDVADNADDTLFAFGLNPTLNLATLDPLAEAEAGDPAPLLVSIKLLDTVTVLARATLIGFSFQPFADFLENNDTIDLDNPADISAVLAPYLASASVSDLLTTQQIGEVIAIAAAGNAAIDAHAAAATSLADTLSYAFAAERLEQEVVAPAVNEALQQTGESEADGFAPLVASYTGTALDTAIEADVGQATQAVSLLPVGPATTGAPRVTFEITFSKAVTGLAPTSFQLVTGGGLQDAAITGVSAVAGSGGAAYDVTVSTGIGEGTLAVTYLGGGVDTSAGKPITAGVIAPAVTYLPLDSPNTFESIVVGDFNGDGRPDAALIYGESSFYSVTPYLNTGAGGFQAEAPLSLDAGADEAISPVVADVNGDGHADILIADYDPNVADGNSPTSNGDAVTVLLGNGDGTFESPINTPLDFVPTQMVAGDFNGDGKTDIAVSDLSGNVHILLGNGAGGFTPVDSFAGGAQTGNNALASMAVGDFNGDGKLDLAVGNDTNGTVSIFLGAGDGTFTAGPVLAAGAHPDAIAIGDLNNDGIADIAVADGASDDSGTSSVTVLLGKGNGTFTATAPFTADPLLTGVKDLNAIAIGDIDNDGTADLVVGGQNGDVAVLLGNGDGTFRLGSVNQGLAEPDTGPDGSGLALADVDGDGRTDILAPGANLAPDLNEDAGLDVFMNEPETVVGSTSPSVTIDRPAVADPELTKTSGAGTLAQDGNAYTLDLGTLAFGAAATTVLSLANAAAAPADSFDGTFSTPTGSGFALTGATLAAAIAAGQSQGGITFTADTSTPGPHSETITFAPRDATAETVQTVSLDNDDGTPVNLPGTPDPNAVAAELPALTLTVTDTVTAAIAPTGPAVLAPVSAIMLPNVRVGGSDTHALTIANSAASGSADLDVTATASGSATVSGSVVGLAPQASDDSNLVVGIDTNAAGAQSGTVALAPVSEPDSALATDDVAVSGDVYREAAASIAPVDITVHVGDPGSAALQVSNTDAPDGFSEALIASITGVTTGLSIASAGPTADIAAGSGDTSSLAVGFSTATAGTITGTATLGLSSDGGTGAGSIDGLGQVAENSVTAPISVQVNNHAVAELTSGNGVLTPGSEPNTFTLDLGDVQQHSSPVAISLDALNAAVGPADDLGGSFTISGASDFTNSGFGAFSDVGAGGQSPTDTVALDTGTPGDFSETIVLKPTGSNNAGYSEVLQAQTVTVTGSVQPVGTAAGNVHLVTFDGLHYDFQADGDFTLAHSTVAGNPFDIEIKTTPWALYQATSLITQAAAQVGTTVVGFGLDGGVVINGIADSGLDAAHPQQLLNGGTLTALGGGAYRLDWAGGEAMTVTNKGYYLDLATSLPASDGPGSVQGLLGALNGQANDIALPNGTVLAQPVATAQLLGEYADAWSVPSAQSLFGNTIAASAGTNGLSAMTFLSAGAPGQVLTGSLSAGGTAGSAVTMLGTLADLAGDTITNFAAHDLIDITDVSSAQAAISYTGSATGGELLIAAGAKSAAVNVSGSLSGGAFHTASDQHGGTLIGFS